jgi:glycosyltransferase involved in cell wall biosynthesis
MSNIPDVSVVMSVFNGASMLEETIQSILAQEAVEFELIAINDGSTDESGKILDRYAQRDDRVRVLHQENKGLTWSLIKGCELARGYLIARQDSGDISHKKRLRKQLNLLTTSPDVVFCSSYSKFVGPSGEYLYTATIDELDMFPVEPSKAPRGPSHHGSVMMRRDAYVSVGGYRRAFYFAQDVDLWSRLLEQGRHATIPEVLYQAQLQPSSLSGRYAKQQKNLAHLIKEATALRRNGGNDKEILEKASQIMPQGGVAGRKGIAAGAYFIGSCLQHRDRRAARRYFVEAIRNNPFLWRAWIKAAGFHG